MTHKPISGKLYRVEMRGEHRALLDVMMKSLDQVPQNRLGTVCQGQVVMFLQAPTEYCPVSAFKVVAGDVVGWIHNVALLKAEDD